MKTDVAPLALHVSLAFGDGSPRSTPAPTIDAATRLARTTSCATCRRWRVTASSGSSSSGTNSNPIANERSTVTAFGRVVPGARSKLGVDEGELRTDDVVDEGGGHAPLIGSRQRALDRRSRRYCVYRRPSRETTPPGRPAGGARGRDSAARRPAAAVARPRHAIRRAAGEPELAARSRLVSSATATDCPSGSSACSTRSTPSSSRSSRRCSSSPQPVSTAATDGERIWFPRLLSALAWIVGAAFLALIARRITNTAGPADGGRPLPRLAVCGVAQPEVHARRAHGLVPARGRARRRPVLGATIASPTPRRRRVRRPLRPRSSPASHSSS